MEVTESRRGPSSNRPLMAALVLSFAVLAAVYSVVTPAWETPDEIWHFGYAAYMRETGDLPVIGVTQNRVFAAPAPVLSTGRCTDSAC